MITIPVASLNASYIFALEYYLMTEKKFTDPIFMIWSTKPTVMLGKYQDVSTEVDLTYIQNHDIQLVRRCSGGGTIYTDNGCCQFSLVQPTNKKIIDFSDGIHIIATALKETGFHITPDSRNDLIDDVGFKVSGNAQYLLNDYRLHHGSLLFDPDQVFMNNALRSDPVKLKAKGISSTRQRTGNLKRQQPTWSPSKFKKELNAAVLNNVPHKIYHLCSKDKERINDIAEQRFCSGNLLSSSEKLSFLKKRYIKGAGLVQLKFEVKENKLRHVRINGDFFSELDPQKFSNILDGTPFTPSAIHQIIEKALQPTPIVGITAGELVDLIFKKNCPHTRH
ncbi:lipoate--protein ligase [Liquorilactobacillus aquaticus]|nr:lipoate protein ligase C-terminal domain-containing protein [Liquorilactobacillus aquaticus]